MARLGFGFLRFPMKEGQIDFEELDPMVEAYMAAGGSYFDTSHNYLEGKSEEAIRRSVVERYPREAFRLATKLPGYDVKSYDECWRYFRESQARCGVEFFDVYMLHWLNREHYAAAEKYREFDFLKELKEKGLAKKIGFSFHDTPALLDEILTAHPEVDTVLIQINYLDWDSPGIQSRLCYETALRHGKEIIVMEPVKGGTLAKIHPEAEAVLKQMDPDRSPAYQAVRFVRSLPGVSVVLSGMGSLAQMRENLLPMAPMGNAEREIMAKAADIIRKAVAVPCTGCGYCRKHCPMGLPIPDYFALYNEAATYPRHTWKTVPQYQTLPSAAQCLHCQSCEAHCPQKLPISEYMAAVAEKFEAQ